jgi:hypothetical protein
VFAAFVVANFIEEARATLRELRVNVAPQVRAESSASSSPIAVLALNDGPRQSLCGRAWVPSGHRSPANDEFKRSACNPVPDLRPLMGRLDERVPAWKGRSLTQAR